MLTHATKFYAKLKKPGGFPGGAVVKNPPASAGDARDVIRSLGREDPLEKEIATHSSILAWETSWTEEPGGLQSMRSPRVRHDWVTDWAHMHTRSQK